MNLSPLPIQKFFDNNGNPLNGGLLFTYVAGTTTKVATYTDSTGSTPNTNPIVLDYRGEARVWLDPTLTYKFTLAPVGDTDPPTKPIWTVDQIASGITLAFLTQQIIGQILYPRTAAEISAGVTPVNYSYAPGDARRYGAVGDFATDDTAALQSWVLVMQQGVTGYLPSTAAGAGYRISSALVVTAPITWSGGGRNKTAIICTASDAIQIAAGVAQCEMTGFRLNFVPRYQEIGGVVTVNTKAGIRMLGTAISQCSNHTYRDVFIDGFRDAVIADGAAFTLFDNCGSTCTKNGILSATFPVNVNIRGGVYQCGDLSNAGALVGSIGVQFGDGATAAQGCTITDGAVISGFATNVWLLGCNYSYIIDSFLDFTNGVGVLAQSVTNAATNNWIIGNYIALTALGTTGIRLLSSTASSDPVGSKIHDNNIIQYAVGAGRGILIDGTNELNNSIKNNTIHAGSTADLDIQTGSGHTVTGNRFLGVGCLSSVPVTFDDNVGTLISNPNTFVQQPLFSVLQATITYSSSMTPDIKTVNSYVITVNNGTAFTINAPTNPPASGGNILRLWISNTSGGALGAVTWSASYKVPAGITYPATGFRRCYEFEQGTAGGNYYPITSPTVDIPN